MDYYSIGQRIRKCRKACMLSQEELAEKIGISTTHMSHIETGNTKLSLPVIVSITEALRVSVDDLLYDNPIIGTGRTHEILLSFMQGATEKERMIILDIVQSVAESLRKNR